MYGYEWTQKNGIYKLIVGAKIEKEIRPVFKEELDFFGMHDFWSYPDTEAPLLWAEGIRRYILNGECVAEAKGGGVYTKPKIIVHQKNLKLMPIDIDALWRENEAMIKGLEQKALYFIQEKHKEFKALGYNFVVAFSGGKDSLLLLDLVSKALLPDEFYVIFSNTGMELEDTIKSVELSKEHWQNLSFYEAQCHLKPEETWQEFGPPGRRMRWCCAVHKSVPTILKLQELTGNVDVKAVVFDGVRAAESASRAQYSDVSVGAKNILQVNCSPILKWNTAELYPYLLKEEILFNRAYRYGLFRVGCKVCPMSSSWWDGITNIKYNNELSKLLKYVEEYAHNAKPQKEVIKYIEQGGWKGRMGGRDLKNGGNRVTESIENDCLVFRFYEKKENWKDVAPLLGPIIDETEHGGLQIIDKREYPFIIDDDCVSYAPYSKMNRKTISYLRGVANKVAYCIGCKACMVQCGVGAFEIKDGQIYIHEEKCLHCGNCISFTNGKGCLVAKSLSTTKGGMNMDLKGMNRYQHFGFRLPWLEHYFEDKNECFTKGKLGNRQYDALKIWLQEAELLSSANKGEKIGMPTPLFEKLEPLGPYHPFTWSVIWANLAYHSIIVKWYMKYVPVGGTYEKPDLVFMLGDDYSQATRENAVIALLETLRHSPIGTTLKQGIPIASGKSYKYIKKGWETPDALAILYSLYLWAEKTQRYSFTLSQLAQARKSDEAVGMDPAVIFGLQPEAFKDILQELALHFGKYLRVTFVSDLDNVKLFPEIASLDIIDMAIN